jgi:hypothetical protein
MSQFFAQSKAKKVCLLGYFFKGAIRVSKVLISTPLMVYIFNLKNNEGTLYVVVI